MDSIVLAETVSWKLISTTERSHLCFRIPHRVNSGGISGLNEMEYSIRDINELTVTARRITLNTLGFYRQGHHTGRIRKQAKGATAGRILLEPSFPALPELQVPKSPLVQAFLTTDIISKQTEV